MRLRRDFGLVVAVFAAFLLAGSAAHAQKVLRDNDIAVEGFAQYTANASGNGITVRATHSGGGAAFLRHSYHWWLGWEAGYLYTRYSNYYTGQPLGRQSNMHEFSGSYYVHGPKLMGVQPFATAGVGAVLFSPSLNGGQHASWQPRLGENFSVGANIPLIANTFGARVEYRGVFYKTPDFDQAALVTDSHRLTSEPMVGLYVRF